VFWGFWVLCSGFCVLGVLGVLGALTPSHVDTTPFGAERPREIGTLNLAATRWVLGIWHTPTHHRMQLLKTHAMTRAPRKMVEARPRNPPCTPFRVV